jgi:glycogen debranching enzyme
MELLKIGNGPITRSVPLINHRMNCTSTDVQFRCNFTLPMIVAPELFTPSRAIDALKLADAVLRGPLGMKTLDPSDSQYRGDYDNSNDSSDMALAKGWNVSRSWVSVLGENSLSVSVGDRMRASRL